MTADIGHGIATPPWRDAYPPEIDWNMPIEHRPLFALLDDAVSKFPDGAAIDFLGRTQSYRDVAGLAARAACGLQQLGVNKGSKVGLFLPNCPYYVVCFFGILKAGGTVVNYSPLDAEQQILDRIEDSETDILITLDAEPLLSKVERIVGRCRLRRVVVCSMAGILPFPRNILFRFFKARRRQRDAVYLSFSDLVANDGRYVPVAIDPDRDLAALQYTGGTTGTPKGAALTHATSTPMPCRSRTGSRRRSRARSAFSRFCHCHMPSA